MSIKLIDGGANTPLSVLVAGALDTALVRRTVDRFPDGEAEVRLAESVVGDDVFIVQPTGPEPDGRLMDLLLLADASRRAGASRITAVVPYFAYARQDHNDGRPVAAGLVPRMMECAGVSQLVALDLHSPVAASSPRMPVRHLSAVPMLAARLRQVLPRDCVVVAPDLGAVKLADRYASILDLPVAFVRKERVSSADVEVHGVTGEVSGRVLVIVDDMISTAGTVSEAARACVDAGASPHVYVAASHALQVGRAIERLRAIPLQSLVVTDSLAAPAAAPACMERVSVVQLIADTISELHRTLPSDG